MTIHSNISVIITAAGSSQRMGSGIKKEYISLLNGTVLSNCAKNFLKTIIRPYYLVDFIITYPKNGLKESKESVLCDSELGEMLNQRSNIQFEFVEGGETRQASVFNALEYIKQKDSNPDIVLIHDGARPFISEKIIKNVIDAAIEYGASVPGVTPIDTQKVVDKDGFITEHLKRSNISSVQTPQGFVFDKLYSAHVLAEHDNVKYTDDTEIWGKYIGKVKVVEGDIQNIKITYPEDLRRL